MAKRYSHSERQQHLDAWQQSGLTKQHYVSVHRQSIDKQNVMFVH